MATYVLIPGGGADPWYWHLLVDELRDRGHDVVAVDLPSDDDSAGLAEYADAAVEAVGDRENLIVVAHSLGGFTGTLLCDRVKVDLLVMLQAMVPKPGESPGEWWAATGYEQARREQDERDARAPDDDRTLFYFDTPPELIAEAAKHPRGQSATPMMKPWPLATWPDVPTRFLLARDDRFFPAEFLRRVVQDRLGIVPDEMPGDHMPMLSHPKTLADRLEKYRLDLTEHP
ncbi:alpha/beta hydrolase [Actinomadura harenae]|uniref:Alpha/beta hydrolase n=1 Tax=Actinomadura harenae TaxID=2483351 RepID=A0A3M2LK63_9ACTN|nr:alpha/beta hydrolase [Actinomadura harenae]RMI37862.1 alpha/beta hydrolase [Actinomadura harenae]